MAKKKASSRPPLPDSVTERLRDARDYAARQKWEEAAEILEALNQRHPKRPEILSPLTDVYAGLGEVVQMLDTADVWRQVAPRSPGALHALLRAYASLNYLVHTWRTGQQFVREFPDDARADIVRAITAAAETDLQQPLPELDITIAEGIELAEWHERARLAMLRNRYPEAQRLCETLLAKYPTFAPALNNLALLHHVAGRLDDAIAVTRRVLELTPDNVHALANLTHYHMMRADVDAARETAARLRASTAEATDRAVKIAEALGFVGDDEGLLELVRETEATPHPFILRLGGVAAWRLGRGNEALALWQAAQRLAPDDDLVRDALVDLKRPVGTAKARPLFRCRNGCRTAWCRRCSARWSVRGAKRRCTPRLGAWWSAIHTWNGWPRCCSSGWGGVGASTSSGWPGWRRRRRCLRRCATSRSASTARIGCDCRPRSWRRAMAPWLREPCASGRKAPGTTP